MQVGIHMVPLAMLVQAACAKPVVVDLGVAPQSVARATVGTHCLVLIDDVEENARVPGPQRHRGARADRGEILRGKLDDACRLCRSYRLACAAAGQEIVPVGLKIQHAETVFQDICRTL